MFTIKFSKVYISDQKSAVYCFTGITIFYILDQRFLPSRSLNLLIALKNFESEDGNTRCYYLDPHRSYRSYKVLIGANRQYLIPQDFCTLRRPYQVLMNLSRRSQTLQIVRQFGTLHRTYQTRRDLRRFYLIPGILQDFGILHRPCQVLVDPRRR